MERDNGNNSNDHGGSGYFKKDDWEVEIDIKRAISDIIFKRIDCSNINSNNDDERSIYGKIKVESWLNQMCQCVANFKNTRRKSDGIQIHGVRAVTGKNWKNLN